MELSQIHPFLSYVRPVPFIPFLCGTHMKCACKRSFCNNARFDVVSMADGVRVLAQNDNSTGTINIQSRGDTNLHQKISLKSTLVLAAAMQFLPLATRAFIWLHSGSQMELSQIHVTTCHTLKQVKQNATNNLTPVFSSVLNALSDSVLRFLSVLPSKPIYL